MGILTVLTELKMSFLTTFAPESCGKRQKSLSERIISENNRTDATVTAIKTCWWIKVNTKAFRRHALDGAKFPHIIYFTYNVNGTAYQGCCCAAYYLRCPNKGETITVFYDKAAPAKYAVGSLGGSL